MLIFSSSYYIISLKLDDHFSFDIAKKASERKIFLLLSYCFSILIRTYFVCTEREREVLIIISSSSSLFLFFPSFAFLECSFSRTMEQQQLVTMLSIEKTFYFNKTISTHPKRKFIADTLNKVSCRRDNRNQTKFSFRILVER